MKATVPDGTVFEGTPEEFNVIRGHSGTAHNGHKPTTKPTNGNPQVWDETNARAFWDSLDPRRKGGKQKKLLQFLIKRGGRATPRDVIKPPAIETGHEGAERLWHINQNGR